jgi:hypothetical protein
VKRISAEAAESSAEAAESRVMSRDGADLTFSINIDNLLLVILPCAEKVLTEPFSLCII